MRSALLFVVFSTYSAGFTDYMGKSYQDWVADLHHLSGEYRSWPHALHPEINKNKQALPLLRALLRDNDPEIRVIAMYHLTTLGRDSVEAINELLLNCEDKNQRTKRYALKVVASIPLGCEAEKVVRTLERLLARQKEIGEKLDVITAIAAIDENNRLAAVTLAAILNQEGSKLDEYSRAIVLTPSLRKLEFATVQVKLIQFSDPAKYSGPIIVHALATLGHYGELAKSAMGVINTSVDHEDLSVRLSAGYSHWKVTSQYKTCLEICCDVLENPSSLLIQKERAIFLLGELPGASERSAQLLQKMREHYHPHIRKAADQALMKRTRKET